MKTISPQSGDDDKDKRQFPYSKTKIEEYIRQIEFGTRVYTHV
jgi:hypothetical protein